MWVPKVHEANVSSNYSCLARKRSASLWAAMTSGSVAEDANSISNKKEQGIKQTKKSVRQRGSWKKQRALAGKPGKLLIPSNAVRSGTHRRASTLPVYSYPCYPSPHSNHHFLPHACERACMCVCVCVCLGGNKNICSLFAVANKFIINLRTSSTFDGLKLGAHNELARSPSNGITDALYLSVCLLCNACRGAS